MRIDLRFDIEDWMENVDWINAICRDVKLMQLEEKILRLESERADLMITIEQGEGSNTVIQQLQQDNV